MNNIRFYMGFWLICLTLLSLVGCGAGAQNFLQKSGAAHQEVEKMNWSNAPSAEATDWTTYMDLEH